MTKKNAVYVFIHPEGNDSLFGVAEPDERELFSAPTFAEAYRIEPEFITHASEGDILIFSDMTIEIKWNSKTEEGEA
jgi:hypothetical protein